MTHRVLDTITYRGERHYAGATVAIAEHKVAAELEALGVIAGVSAPSSQGDGLPGGNPAGLSSGGTDPHSPPQREGPNGDEKGAGNGAGPAGPDAGDGQEGSGLGAGAQGEGEGQGEGEDAGGGEQPPTLLQATVQLVAAGKGLTKGGKPRVEELEALTGQAEIKAALRDEVFAQAQAEGLITAEPTG